MLINGSPPIMRRGEWLGLPCPNSLIFVNYILNSVIYSWNKKICLVANDLWTQMPPTAIQPQIFIGDILRAVVISRFKEV